MAETIDKTALATLRTLQRPGQRDFLTEMIDIFFADVAKTLGELHQTLEAGNATAFGRAGHALKSSCAILGAQKMTAIAQEIQILGAGGDLTNAASALARLEAEYALVRAILETERR